MLINSITLVKSYVQPSDNQNAFAIGSSGQSIDFSPSNWVIIGVYLFSILCIGIYFSVETKFKKRYTQTSQNFFMASKSIPGWAVGFSLFATSLSAITFLSVPSQTFSGDWIIVCGSILSSAFAPFLIKYIVPFFRKLKAESAYDYIHKRFGLHLRLLISISFIFFQVMRAAIVVYLPTIAISTIIPQANEYLIAAIVIIVTIGYSYLGGIKSIIWADLIQGFLLTAGILIMIFYSIGLINNHSTVTDYSGTGGFAQSNYDAYSDGKYIANGHWILTLTGLGIPLVFMSYFVNAIYPLVGGQDVVQRYQASKTKHDVNVGIILNATLSILVGTMMFYGFGSLLYQLFSSTNQVAYNVIPFTYGSQNISQIWVANTAIEGTHIFGYTSNGWLPLTGNINNSSITNIVGNKSWESLTLVDIKNLSIANSTRLDNGALVSIGSIVSNYKDFDKSYGVVSNSNLVPYFIATALPVGLSGLIIAGILAASQSAMGSCFNASSRCFVNDILKIFYPFLSDWKKLIIGKVAVVVVGAFALLFTMVLISTKQSSIFLFFNSVVGLFGASTLAIFFMGMFGNYIRNKAAVTAMWVGLIVALISFLLSYAPFMSLFKKEILLSNAWVAVFSFVATYVTAYSFQFIENIITHNFYSKQLSAYSRLTKLGEKLNANNNTIEKFSRYGLEWMIAKKCIFNSNTIDEFEYKKIYNNTITLNRLGTKLFNENKLSESKIIWMNRFGWAWFFIRYDTPRNDLEFYKRIKNNTLKDISEKENLGDLGENSWNWDVLAYRRYVKNLYKNKFRSSNIDVLEEKQISFNEFKNQTSYQRYLLHTKISNLFKLKMFRKQILSEKELLEAQKLFELRENS